MKHTYAYRLTVNGVEVETDSVDVVRSLIGGGGSEGSDGPGEEPKRVPKFKKRKAQTCGECSALFQHKYRTATCMRCRKKIAKEKRQNAVAESLGLN